MHAGYQELLVRAGQVLPPRAGPPGDRVGQPSRRAGIAQGLCLAQNIGSRGGDNCARRGTSGKIGLGRSRPEGRVRIAPCEERAWGSQGTTPSLSFFLVEPPQGAIDAPAARGFQSPMAGLQSKRKKKGCGASGSPRWFLTWGYAQPPPAGAERIGTRRFAARPYRPGQTALANRAMPPRYRPPGPCQQGNCCGLPRFIGSPWLERVPSRQRIQGHAWHTQQNGRPACTARPSIIASALCYPPDYLRLRRSRARPPRTSSDIVAGSGTSWTAYCRSPAPSVTFRA